MPLFFAGAGERRFTGAGGKRRDTDGRTGVAGGGPRVAARETNVYPRIIFSGAVLCLFTTPATAILVHK